MLRAHRGQAGRVLRVRMMLQELRRVVMRRVRHHGRVEMMSRVVAQRRSRVPMVLVERRVQLMLLNSVVLKTIMQHAVVQGT